MAEAIAPPAQNQIKEPNGVVINKVPISDGAEINTTRNLGWETPAPLQYENKNAEDAHFREYAPKAAAAVQGMSPNATSEQKVQAANALKEFSGPKNNEDFAGSHDIRWDVVFEPTGGIAGIIRGLNGGSDVREIGRNGDGTPVVTVYNGRGEVRRYESLSGERVSPEKLKELGPITSVRDISAERASAFRARGLSAEQIAAAQSKAWQRDLNAADLFSREAGTAYDINNQIKALSKELVFYSTNPATRTILARIGTLTANKEQQASIARERLNRFSRGEAENDEFTDTKREYGGIMGTFSYQKGKGLSAANGVKLTEDEVNSLANRIAASNSTAEKIQSNAQNLANFAQLVATENKLPIIDKIQQLVGLKAQAALIEKKFEDAGGVPGFKGSPNVAHNVTDSFSLAYANAEYGSSQAAAAKAYAELVLKKKGELGFKTPDMGVLASEFSYSDVAKNLRKERTKNVEAFRSEIAPVLEQLSRDPVYNKISEQVSGVAVKPPTLAEESKETSKAKPAKKPKQKSPYDDALNSLFPKN